MLPTRPGVTSFGWRGQFTPEFVAYLLDEANEGTGLVVDPFCGSGNRASGMRGEKSRGAWF
jgi:hypothetical protein